MVFAICGIEKSKAATDNNKKKAYDKILAIPTFLNSDILVNSGNMKNNTYKPLKEYILLIPSTKVSFNP